MLTHRAAFHQLPERRHTFAALLGLAVVFTGACTDALTGGGGARRPVTVSLTTQAQGALASRSMSSDVTIAAGSNALIITKAQLVARRIELTPTSASGCAAAESGDDDASDGCAEVESGPTLLDLPLDAGTKTSVSASVAAGSYRALELRIGPVTSGNRSSVQFLAAHPELKGVSVRVEGTFNGKSFVFVSAFDARIESMFATPITIDASQPNVTVAIDITNWFTDGAGGTLDPGNGSNAARISANIASSFHAFEDDDHDGHEDHHQP